MPILGNSSGGGKRPSTPTIGTAVDGGTGTTVSVAFTPSSYIGKGTILYTALSNPDSITATGSGSPITVSGLTTGTAYTFTVKGDTNYGVASSFSGSSNSIAPIQPTAFESIATATTSGVSTITFSSIPQTYKHLQVRYKVMMPSAGNALEMRLNNETSSGYYARHTMSGNGAGFTTNGATSGVTTSVGFQQGSNQMVGNTFPNVGIVDINDYESGSRNKTIRIFDGGDNNSTGGYTDVASALFLSTNSVSSITFFSSGDSFGSGTTFALYGIKA